MMPLSELLKRSQKFVLDNSPTILTTIAVTGTLTTAYLTGKATVQAIEIIREEQLERHSPLDHKDKVKLVWKEYIPPATTVLVTIACIILSNRIGNRRAAALAAVYAISEKAFEEYKLKVIESIGAKKEQGLRDELAQERITRNPVGTKEVIIAGSGSVLCNEAFTGRYFISDMETLRKAQNDINHQVLNDSYASLSDFYDLISLPHTSNSDDVGWNSDKLLELQFSATLTEDGRPCISVEFVVSPVRHYFRLS